MNASNGRDIVEMDLDVPVRQLFPTPPLNSGTEHKNQMNGRRMSTSSPESETYQHPAPQSYIRPLVHDSLDDGRVNAPQTVAASLERQNARFDRVGNPRPSTPIQMCRPLFSLTRNG